MFTTEVAFQLAIFKHHLIMYNLKANFAVRLWKFGRAGRPLTHFFTNVEPDSPSITPVLSHANLNFFDLT